MRWGSWPSDEFRRLSSVDSVRSCLTHGEATVVPELRTSPNDHLLTDLTYEERRYIEALKYSFAHWK